MIKFKIFIQHLINIGLFVLILSNTFMLKIRFANILLSLLLIFSVLYLMDLKKALKDSLYKMTKEDWDRLIRESKRAEALNKRIKDEDDKFLEEIMFYDK